MPKKRLVYTRSDGGVNICAPSDTAMRFMTNGGGRWNGFDKGFLDRQIASQSEACGERNARRFVQAMQFGGCTDAEAYEIMRDRFCAHLGTGIELWNASDVPTDRWFREAWVRSHNGGPISVSLEKAKKIHFRKLINKVWRENAARKREIDRQDSLLTPDWSKLRTMIKEASDVESVRRIWVDGLSS